MPTVQYIDGQRDRLNPADRGFAYGDGLFETMRVSRGRICRLDYHIERLELGCRRLAMPVPDRDTLKVKLHARLPPASDAVLKLVLTRGAGERGYAPPADPICTAVISVHETGGAMCEHTPVNAGILDFRLSEHEKLAGIKHLCRIEQVLAQLELKRRGLEEGILLSRSGHVVGCTSANLFAVFGDRVVTPKIEVAGIAGVMRRAVIAAAPAAGIAVSEENLSPTVLGAADELFLTNAIVGIRSIGSLDGRLLPLTGVADKCRTTVEAAEHA